MLELGFVEVYWGGMFTGKTTKLIKLLKEHSGEAVCFKPSTDNRDDGVCRTHDGDEFPVITVNKAIDIFQYIPAGVKYVGIEEASLFLDDNTLLDTVNSLRNQGYHVIITGLDVTAEGVPFGQMPLVAAIADEAVKLHTKCAKCDGKSSISYRKGGKSTTVEIGGADKYLPLCRNCWYSALEKEGE